MVLQSTAIVPEISPEKHPTTRLVPLSNVDEFVCQQFAIAAAVIAVRNSTNLPTAIPFEPNGSTGTRTIRTRSANSRLRTSYDWISGPSNRLMFNTIVFDFRVAS